VPLVAGQTLSNYEILGPLGVGAMGEVYRARDTRLGREVAIKVLPEELAGDEERLQRFEREARTLASLNHPNVAGIHGVDRERDLHFLALELVPGEDLATRLGRGPLAVDEALDVARQIADGLAAAHDAGVVHRDLKPANVRITPDGVVKLLDFGLAKPVGTREGSGTGSDEALVTEAGRVLGTPTYMSPEQARGRRVDRRTDLWALGCVLYECLSGRRAFAGDSVTDVLAAVVEREPDWSALPPATPAAARRVLARCLVKEPRRRLDSAAMVRLELDGEPAGPAAIESAVERTSPVARALPWLVTTVAIALAVGALLRAPEEPARQVRRYEVRPEVRSNFELSPDGELLALVGRDGVRVQRLGKEFEPGLRSDVPRAGGLVFSPDGRRIAGAANDREGATYTVEVHSLEGGAPQVLTSGRGQCVVTDWSGREVFFRASGEDREATRLYSVSEIGGEARLLATWPRASSDGWIISVRIVGDGEQALVLEYDPRGSNRLSLRPLGPDGGDPAWIDLGGDVSGAWLLPEGSLTWVRSEEGRRGLWEAPFDLPTAKLSGPPLPVVEGLSVFAGSVSLTPSTLAYRPIEAFRSTVLEWIDANGKVTPTGLESSYYSRVRPSPTSSLIALVANSEDTRAELWVWDSAPGAVFLERVATGRGFMEPVWSGESLWYMVGEQVYRTGPPWTEDPEPVLEIPRLSALRDASVDGSHLVYTTFGALGTMIWPTDGATEPWILDERSPARFAALSPDGRWIAYRSATSGIRALYVRPFPDTGAGRTQVVVSGPGEGLGAPSWSAAGNELHYRESRGGRLMRIQVHPPGAGGEFRHDPPEPVPGVPEVDLESGALHRTVDGRWLFEPYERADSARIRIIENWAEEVRARRAQQR